MTKRTTTAERGGRACNRKTRFICLQRVKRGRPQRGFFPRPLRHLGKLSGFPRCMGQLVRRKKSGLGIICLCLLLLCFFSVVLFASLFGCVSLLLSFYVPFSSLFLLYLFYFRPCPSPFMTLSLSSPLPLALLHPLPLPHSLSTAVPKLSKTEKVRHNNRS